MTSKIERMADLERRIITSGNKNVCRISFRAYINGKWYTAQGEEATDVNGSLDSACTKALNAGKITILEKASGTKITGNQEMICTDKPMPQDKQNVQIGDTVWESEVQLHPIYREVFRYRGSVCRWFIESQPRVGGVDMQQGIICRSPDQKVWRVIDKW